MIEGALVHLSMIGWQPLIGVGWLIALVCVGLVLAGWGWWRRVPGTGLRLAGLGLLVGFLAHPVIRTADMRPQPDIAVIVLDESPASRIGARPVHSQRVLEAVSRAGAALPDLEWRIVRVGSTADPQSDAPQTIMDETRLFTALERAVQDIPRQRLAGTIIISDGQIHDIPAQWSRNDGPVHLILPAAPGETDRRLAVLEAPAFGLTGQEVAVTVRVDDLADDKTGTEKRPLSLRLRRDQDEPVTVPLETGTDQVIRVPITHPGPNIIELAAESLPGEVSGLNNRALLSINGVRDRLKVLLVSGHPYPGERTWRNLLKSDPAVELVHFTILRTPDRLDATPIREMSLIAFPVRDLFETKLHEFDLVIFDNYEQQGILPGQYYQNIADYVRQGGALLIVNGAGYGTDAALYHTQLADILPGAPTGPALTMPYRPDVTALGRRHIVTAPLAENPVWGRWLRTLPTNVSAGDVLMNGANSQPLLILNHQEQGRVAQLNSDHIWLWDRGFDGGGPHAEFLRRLAHWLMKEPALAENSLNARIEGAQLVVTRRDLHADQARLLIIAPDGTHTQKQLTLDQNGTGTLRLPVDMPGAWRVEEGNLLTVAQAGRLNAPELADLRHNDRLMADLVAQSGGGVFWATEGNIPALRRTEARDRQAGHDWLGLARRHQGVLQNARQIDMIPVWLALALGMGLLVAGWWRESR